MKVTDKYVFFCDGILSNWANTPMMYDNKHFKSSEQLFMYLKAVMFGDDEVAEKILNCKTPKEAKELGRRVKNFDQKIWDNNKEKAMRASLLAKALFSDEFLDTLIKYKGKTFVECNPYDNVWAIGLSENDTRIENKKNWQGQNLLGKILTSISKNSL